MIIPACGGENFVNSAHFLDSPFQIADWSSGWTSIKFYDVGGQPYLLILKKEGLDYDENANVHIFDMDEYGNLRKVIHEKKWSEGWTSVEFFKINNKTYLFCLKETRADGNNNNVNIHEVYDNGDINRNIVYIAGWTKGWTIARFFSIGGKNYFFFLKKNGAASDGNNVHINVINNDGTIAYPWKHSYKWTENWTSAEFYTIAGKVYLFLLKVAGTGYDGKNVHIHEMNNDGSVGTRIYSDLMDEGWLQARFFRAYGTLYMLINNIRTGEAHFHHVLDDGKIGSRVAAYPQEGHHAWTHEDWTSFEFFNTNHENCFLYLMSARNGQNRTLHVIPMTDVGPMVSFAGENEAIIWIGLVGGSPQLRQNSYSLRYREKSGSPGTFVTVNIIYNNVINQDYYTSGIFRLNVLPDKEYEYELYYGSNLQTTGKFFTPPVKGTPKKFLVSFASCMSLNYGRYQQSWTKINEVTPKLLILVGDNAYSNSNHRSNIWLEHLQQRAVQSFAKLIKNVCTLATWDDHDFGKNDSLGGLLSAAKRIESKSSFLELFPHFLYNLSVDKGINFYYTWGEVDFIFLDCRYFKQEEGGEMIGDLQMTWLERTLAISDSKIKVIISSSTILYHNEDWINDHLTEWDELTRLLISYPNTFIVSGDIHVTKIVDHQISYKARRRNLTEVITSGISQRIDENSQEHPAGYVNIVFDTTCKIPQAEISIHYKDGTLKETRTLNF